jgi:hypothetical protein
VEKNSRRILLLAMPDTVDFIDNAGLIVNLDDYRSYNGFSGNIRTKYMDCKELETLKGNLAFWGAVKISSWRGSYFLRNHTSYYLKTVVKQIALYFSYLLISQKDPRQLNIYLRLLRKAILSS